VITNSSEGLSFPRMFGFVYSWFVDTVGDVCKVNWGCCLTVELPLKRNVETDLR